MNKLKLAFVNYGLGKYYTWKEKDGTLTPVIEMNKNMLKFDEQLFIWVFNHELDHYRFYQDERNRGKKNNMFKEVTRLISNPKMFKKLNKFERTNKNVYEKKFIMEER